MTEARRRGFAGEVRICVAVMVLTGIRSRYFWRMRSASALRFSKGCSSLNLDRILVGVGEDVARALCGEWWWWLLLWLCARWMGQYCCGDLERRQEYGGSLRQRSMLCDGVGDRIMKV